MVESLHNFGIDLEESDLEPIKDSPEKGVYNREGVEKE
jgi:hypothetical protein